MTTSHRRRRATEIMERLRLERHPERGFFSESYRSSLSVEGAEAPLPHGGPRAACTAIYFLLTAEEPATYLHRLRSDEVFHFYEGGPLELLSLRDGEPPSIQRLGLDFARGERPQLVVPAGAWFAAELVEGAAHCLFGCTVAPGFEFADFELASGPELAARFPTAAARIARMLRA